MTWAAFGALFAFGVLNAVLGPSLPYLRAVEHISYLVGALHQAAFALGGGLAGFLAARQRPAVTRTTVIVVGLCAASAAGLIVGYGARPALTIPGAMLMSLFATSALIRLWATVADIHGAQRAVAMTEGEVSVSLAGILIPLVIGALATTAVSWRFTFVIATAAAALASAGIRRIGLPDARGSAPAPSRAADLGRRSPKPTLIVVFAIVALEFSLSFWLASFLNDDVGMARDAAAAAVSGLYAANLAGRLLASRLARRAGSEGLLAVALGTALIGAPILLTAHGALQAILGTVIAGMGIGALFPLTSALHVHASRRDADSALGQVLVVASAGQLVGPLVAGAIAQAASLRAGLWTLPALIFLAAAGLRLHRTRAAR